jgi:hypothetical protein
VHGAGWQSAQQLGNCCVVIQKHHFYFRLTTNAPGHCRPALAYDQQVLGLDRNFGSPHHHRSLRCASNERILPGFGAKSL